MLKRAGQILFVALLVIGVTVTAAVLYATSESGSRRISLAVRGAIREQTGLSVSFRDIDLGALPPRLTLREIRAEDEKGLVRCTVEEADLAPNFLAILSGSLEIEEVYLGAPRCRVSLDVSAMDEVRKARQRAAAKSAGSAEAPGIDLSTLPKFEAFALSDGFLELTVDDREGVGILRAVVEEIELDVTGGDDAIEVRGLVGGAAARLERGGRTIDERLEGLEVRVGVSPKGFEIRRFAASVGGASVRARDAFVPVPLWPAGPRVDDFSVSLPLERLSRLPLDLPPMAGILGAAGSLSVRRGASGSSEVSARGRISLQGGNVDGLVVGDVGSFLSLGPEGVSFSETTIATAEGIIRTEGSVAFDDGNSIEASVDFDNVELSRLLWNLGLKGAQVSQANTGTARVVGKLSPLTLDVRTRITVRNHSVWSTAFTDPKKQELLAVPEATVTGALRVADGGLSAQGLDVVLGDTRVAVDLGFAFDVDRGWRLEARSEKFDLKDVARIAGLAVAGKGRVFCRIVDAPYGDPRIEGNAEFDNLEMEGIAFDRGAARVRFKFPELVFENVALHGPNTSITTPALSLLFGGRESLTVHGDFTTEEAAIEDLARAFRIDLSEWGSVRGRIRGGWSVDYTSRDDALRLEASVEHDGLVIAGESFGPGGLEFVYADRALDVSRFDARKGKGAIAMSGSALADGAIDFMATAREVPLSSIDFAPFRALGLEGEFQAVVDLGGTRARPKGTIDLRLDGTRHNGVSYGASHISAELDGDKLVGRGDLGNHLVALEHGTIDLGSKRFSVEAFAYELDLLPLVGFRGKDRRASVEVTGEVAVGGSFGGKLDLTGRAAVDAVRVAFADFEIENERRVIVTAKDGAFTLAPARFRGDWLVFDLSGRANSDKMNLSLRGVGDLAILDDLLGPVSRSSGRLLVECTASGPWSDPRFFGRATVENGFAVVNGLPTPLEDVKGSIAFGEKSIRFEKFSARAADGRISVDGQVDLEGLSIENYRFRAALDRLSLAPMADMGFVVSTARDGLFLKRGRRGLPSVTGDVEISDFKFSQDFRMVQLSDFSLSRFTSDRAASPRVFEEKDDSFEYDVRLHGRRNLSVRNNMVDVALRIDDEEEPLRFVGTNQAFGLLGRVLGTKGQVRFQGQVFDIRYASLVFRDKLRVDNPSFRVTADGQVRDWRVSFTAEGTVDDYRIVLTSQPYLSNEDIAFLLLTGMTKAERQQYGGNEIAPLSDLVSNVGGEMIPVEVRIYSEYSEQAGKDTTRLSLGKRLSDDIWVAVSSSVGKEREIEANLEYKLNDRFSLFGDFDNESQAGNLGVDLRFRLEF